MIRKILVPIRNDGMSDSVFAHAAALARRFDAHVEAVHARPRAEDMMPFGVPLPASLRQQIVASARSVADAEELNMRTEFDRLVAAHGLTIAEAPNGAPQTVSWREVAGRQVDVIKTFGRLADLIVVAKPDHETLVGVNTLRAALFQSGRPVLMCPPTTGPIAKLGEHVALAWNGSTEAARAVALNLDVIQKASAVTVLTVDHEEVHGASAADLQSYLKARGVAANLDRFAHGSDAVGKALMKRAAALGCDLMIMGAYGESYEKEAIFGGNTQVVVDNAESAVILVH